MGDMLNLSTGQRTAFMGAILTMGGVLLEKATLSIKRTWKAGENVRKSSAHSIKATFTAPKHPTLHWEGKLVPNFIKESKERLAYLVCQTLKKAKFLVSHMAIGADWLVSEWDHNDTNYQEAETYVGHVKVVNDLSERDVKLTQDLSTSVTNDETQNCIASCRLLSQTNPKFKMRH
ncbi:hypothetical protein AVEN_245545-1 [Araneus ventricosus]|uniref:Uncharacterized protein n=1 Tax=Araneus ventricosus TaxID=182803 RepID=A0A4Y2JSJ9_ARAVE|nr:hypothetical protein AVEN_245545-1 [Araneus ventricosus]